MSLWWTSCMAYYIDDRGLFLVTCDPTNHIHLWLMHRCLLRILVLLIKPTPHGSVLQARITAAVYQLNLEPYMLNLSRRFAEAVCVVEASCRLSVVCIACCHCIKLQSKINKIILAFLLFTRRRVNTLIVKYRKLNVKNLSRFPTFCVIFMSAIVI